MNRRQFVSLGSATVVAATAGCSGILGDGDGGSGDGGSEADSAGQEQADQATAQSPPSVRFEFDYDESAGAVTIQHRGGDSIEADSVTVNGAAGDVDWGTETISAGDSVTVSVGDTGSVSVVWTSETGASQELATSDSPG